LKIKEKKALEKGSLEKEQGSRAKRRGGRRDGGPKIYLRGKRKATAGSGSKPFQNQKRGKNSHKRKGKRVRKLKKGKKIGKNIKRGNLQVQTGKVKFSGGETREKKNRVQDPQEGGGIAREAFQTAHQKYGGTDGSQRGLAGTPIRRGQEKKAP